MEKTGLVFPSGAPWRRWSLWICRFERRVNTLAWHDEWPHKVYASVLLLDGKIEGWKTGNPPKKEPGEFKAYWKKDRLNDYTVEYFGFEVNNDQEHNDAFEILAPEWFRQWELADDLHGSPPYNESPRSYHDEARKYLPSSNCLKRKYACVIVNKHWGIISVGFNYKKTPCEKCARENVPHNTGDYSECGSIHAEQMALLSLGSGPTLGNGRLHGAKMYLVCDQDPDPTPCPTCERLMDWCGVTLVREVPINAG